MTTPHTMTSKTTDPSPIEDERPRTPTIEVEGDEQPQVRGKYDTDTETEKYYHARDYKPRVGSFLPGLGPRTTLPESTKMSLVRTHQTSENVTSSNSSSACERGFSRKDGDQENQKAGRPSSQGISDDVSNRKRKRENVEQQLSPDDGVQRQSIDYVPKHKRNQPKVAPAYR